MRIKGIISNGNIATDGDFFQRRLSGLAKHPTHFLIGGCRLSHEGHIQTFYAGTTKEGIFFYRLYTIRNKYRFDTRALIEGVGLNVLDTFRNDQVHDGFTLEKDGLCLICQVVHGTTAILKDVAPVGQVGNVDGADG